MKRGRKHKFKNGDIVTDNADQHYVVVDWRTIGYASQYRVIPLNRTYRVDIPLAKWLHTDKLHKTGLRARGKVRPYRANQWLEKEYGRGCRCECCIHTALDGSDFNSKTGELFYE